MKRIFLALVLVMCGGVSQAQRYVKPMSTLSQMLTNNPQDVQTNIFLLGRTNVNDGGGGLFTWDVNGTDPEKNGLIFKTQFAGWTNSNGRFYRELNGEPVTPEMFGARGDGTTDDTIAWTDMALYATNIYVPPKSYRLTSGIVFSNNNVSIQGVYGGSVLTNVNVPTVLYFPSLTNISVANLSLAGSYSVGIYLSACTNACVSRTLFTGGRRIPSPMDAVCAPLRVETCDDVSIEQCRLRENGTGLTNTYGFYLSGNHRLSALKNRFSGFLENIQIASFNSWDTQIAGNYVDGGNHGTNNAYGYGIMCYTASAGNRSFVHDNTVTNCYGIGIYIASSPYSAIHHNIISDTGKSMSDATLPVGAISLNDAAFSVVEGNIITNSVKDGIVLATADGAIVRGNTIGSITQYGIRLRGAFKHVLVTDNVITNSASGIYNDTSFTDGVIGRNIIDTTSGLGIFSLSMTSSAVENNVLNECSTGMQILGGTKVALTHNLVHKVAGSNTGIDFRAGSSHLFGNVLSGYATKIDNSGSGNSVITLDGDMVFETPGKFLRVREGVADCSIGVATLAAGTVTVSNTHITANTRIIPSRITGAAPGHLTTSKSVGVSFTITSSNGADNGDVFWMLVEAQ